MSHWAAVTLTVSLIVFGSLGLFLLERRGKARRRESSRRYERSLDAPEFGALEAHFQHPLPACFRELYSNQNLIRQTDILVEVPNPAENEQECYIAFFEPATVAHASSSGSNAEGLFSFANNGAGDQFLIDPRQTDPEVIYYLHETGKRTDIGVTLSKFLKALRRSLPDEKS